MKKIIAAALLSSVVTTPALAAGNTIGASYMLSDPEMLGVNAQFDVSDKFNKAPVSARVFYMSGSSSGTKISAIGAAGLYDLSAQIKLDKNIHPYVGLGLASVKVENPQICLPIVGCVGGGSTSDSELYLTAGLKYDATPKVSLEASFNDWGPESDLMLGVNYKY